VCLLPFIMSLCKAQAIGKEMHTNRFNTCQGASAA